MSKFDQATINRWAGYADAWLAKNLQNFSRNDVTTGREAWSLANRVGITNEAYRNRDVTDGHIQTVLEKIFPNAVFKDKKVY